MKSVFTRRNIHKKADLIEAASGNRIIHKKDFQTLKEYSEKHEPYRGSSRYSTALTKDFNRRRGFRREYKPHRGDTPVTNNVRNVL